MVQFDTFVKVINGGNPMTKVTASRPATIIPVVKVYKAPCDRSFTFRRSRPPFYTIAKILSSQSVPGLTLSQVQRGGIV